MSRLLHPFTPPAKDTEDFLNIVSGKGSVLTLKDGREILDGMGSCLLYTSPSPRDYAASRMPSSA